MRKGRLKAFVNTLERGWVLCQSQSLRTRPVMPPVIWLHSSEMCASMHVHKVSHTWLSVLHSISTTSVRLSVSIWLVVQLWERLTTGVQNYWGVNSCYSAHLREGNMSLYHTVMQFKVSIIYYSFLGFLPAFLFCFRLVFLVSQTQHHSGITHCYHSDTPLCCQIVF